MRVVIAEDSALLRQGVARLLEDRGVEIVAALDDATDILRVVREATPDVVITDVRMPPTYTDEGIRAARQILEHCPGTGVLVLSQYLDTEYARELLHNVDGGVGYLLKERVGDVSDFFAALQRVAAGEIVLDTELYRDILGGRFRRPATDLLTDREHQVLELVAVGLSNSGISGRLGISDRAVEKHVTSILSKLRIPGSPDGNRRVLAVLDYLRARGRV
ncbi:response regulator transcription factor [Streptomyces sp. 11x1]|uniref:response regulator transcription factor n=1 Tax=Streptomyces sp. 11x1 TaxID=3038642 RepID=UPI00292CD10B|nr:response regulator transcription factor [Streptomyces sp. 11x1]WNZ08516.1 response regulator transcription factor [Streptomyces sp. 11x1]